jgi:hypothetical protein
MVESDSIRSEPNPKRRPGRGVAPPRGLVPRRSLTGARKLEERAEEIVDAYLRAGEQGDWRALDALVNRVYEKPKEIVVSEQAEPEWKRQLDDFSTDALTRIVHKDNPEVLARMEENGSIRRVDDMTAEERDDLLRALTFQPRLRAVEDEPDEEAVV